MLLTLHLSFFLLTYLLGSVNPLHYQHIVMDESVIWQNIIWKVRPKHYMVAGAGCQSASADADVFRNPLAGLRCIGRRFVHLGVALWYLSGAMGRVALSRLGIWARLPQLPAIIGALVMALIVYVPRR